MSDAPFLSGQLLLSMPGIGDPRFERVVIAMCLHDDDGALGLVVNRPMGDLGVRALMQQLDIDPGDTPETALVMQGGPVEPARGFRAAQRRICQGQGTISVGGRWGLTSTLDVLRDIAAGKGPQRWLATLGYTGWGPGQLDGEMTRHGWMAAPGDPALLFDTPADRGWPAAWRGLGIDVDHLSATAGRA